MKLLRKGSNHLLFYGYLLLDFQAMNLCLVLVFLSGVLSPVVIIVASTELRNATYETFSPSSSYLECLSWLPKTSSLAEASTSKSEMEVGKNGNILKEKKLAKDEICTIEEKANEAHAIGQERWAFKRSDGGRPVCRNTAPTDVIVSSAENKLADGVTLEKVHSLVSLGVRSNKQYDPVKDIQDFTTMSFEEINHQTN